MLTFFMTIVILVITVFSGLLCLIFFPFYNQILRNWAKALLSISGVRIQVFGLENLKSATPAIIAINHESALDIPVAFAALPIPMRFMAKKELFRIPVVGWVLYVGGHIPIDRQNPKKAIETINRCSAQIIERGLSIIVSPEGTRSPDGKIGSFKKGGFRIADRADIPIIPVTLLGTRYCVAKKALKIVSGKVQVIIDKPVKTSDFSEIEECSAFIRNIMVRRKDQYEASRGGD